MTAPDERLRPPPHLREAGPELLIDLAATLRALRDEPHPAKEGHRQISVLHRGHERLVLFAFEAGGRLPAHAAPGLVTIHVLGGTLRVRTNRGAQDVGAGQVLVLDPDLEHEVEALERSDMLLGFHFARPGSAG
ncbi:MAG TPA: AraC family ligand binding domain-containing protein [Gemmatimonadales bacterium]|jgi:quercetin dioxygenase-like cupin family protein|nr:AraC family ligand binding domain-containing protein [Gemmatimonadales bacterium]